MSNSACNLTPWTACKDAPPQQTIRRIKAILARSGIEVAESDWINNGDRLFALGLHLRGFPFRVNGKGPSRLLARASAYGELAERLQNQLLYYRVLFRPEARVRHGFQFDVHEQVVAGEALPQLPAEFKQSRLLGPAKNYYNLWAKTRKTLIYGRHPTVLVPFYDVAKDRVVYLPRNFILNGVSSNGMCAGNTPEEALVHGLSEILERYVQQQIYFREIAPPAIPAAYLRRHAPAEYETIQMLESTGDYRVIVKDCSLGRGLPVIGTILVCCRSNSYAFNLGAHPRPQIALARCLTEAFQGQILHAFQGAQPLNLCGPFEAKADRINQLNVVRLCKGYYPPSLFADRFDYQFAGFPRLKFRTQRAMMQWLLELIRQLGGAPLIRDVSFLGFPAYQIVVPGISEIKRQSFADWKEMVFTIPLLDYLRRLPHLRPADLRKLADDMQIELADESFSRGITFASYLGLPVHDFAPWQGVTVELMLALVHYRLGDRQQADRWMRLYLGALALGQLGVRYSLLCAARDFISLGLQWPAARVKRVLQPLYGRDILAKIGRAFAPNSNLFEMLRVFFPDFVLPHCWDCARCPAERHCRYRELEATHLRLKRAIRTNPIDQLALRGVVSGKRDSRPGISSQRAGT